jgi:two-component system cell cycle sensor histidine kinase/response regulator CckA
VAHAREGGPQVNFFTSRAQILQARDIAEALFHDEADGVALLDAQGIVLRANARLRGLLGPLQGQTAWAEMPAHQGAALEAALRAGRPCAVATTLDRRGVPNALRLVLLPIQRGGGLLRVIDHTHEQAIEDQLGQAQRLQAVGELAGGIAHDFNNLLTAIIGTTDDMRARAGSDLDREDRAQIRACAERGAALVRQLLAFSRQQTLQPRVISLNDAIRNAALLLERLLGSDVAMTLQLEEPERMVCIDPTQLDQVLVNLAVNASHAMPEGGKLAISSTPRLVLRPEKFGGEMVPPGRYACLSVADTGAGIPPEILPRIFEPFFTTRREKGGTGLGLSTVHGIVRQSGGYMAVESSPGAGTVFRILLPRHEEDAPWRGGAAAETVQPLAVSGKPCGGRKILLVDDEAPVRRLAAKALTREGWQVIPATSAEDALETITRAPPGPELACVISDVVMPGMDGPALVRRLRQKWPGLPAILMSGYADAGLRQSLQAADIFFLAKPFGMNELTRAAATLVSPCVTAGDMPREVQSQGRA